MATAKKLKSGNWNVRAFDYIDENGKRIYKSFTAPTKAEAEYLAATFRKDKQFNKKTRPEERMTVGDAIDKYIDLCSLLSPSTISGYNKIRKNYFKDLMDVKVKDLDDSTVQRYINAESRIVGRRGQISPKTVRNAWGLVSSSLREICGLSFNVKLPQDKPVFKEYPDPEKVIAAVKGSDIELPCMLSIWLSFSMSEIRGLMCSSIRNGCIYVDQVLIDVDNMKVYKDNAKVSTRNRKLALPDTLAEMIYSTEVYKTYVNTGEDAPLIKYTSYTLNRKFKKLMADAGIDGLTFHSLRHLNASAMLALDIPTKYAMERGGWKTPKTMHTVYQHTFSKERQKVDKKVDDYFENILSALDKNDEK